MKKSGFQKVVEVRKIQEKQAQQHVADAERLRVIEEDVLGEIHQHKRNALGNARGTQRMSIAEMQLVRSHLSSLSKQIETQTSVVIQVQEEEKVKRELLLKKSQEKKMVEILHAKKLK